MLQFEDSFFEDEVRDGFYVPAMIKKAWAAELTVMHEVDKICQKHNIAYYADWGTMLGAVRHGGFVPWDDDIDIMMHRRDYERFLAVAEKELPQGFAVLNIDNTENFWYFLSRVTIKPKICFEEEHLKQFHGFPYIAGIDVFILDTMSSDSEKEKQREKVIEYVLAIADSLGIGKLSAKDREYALCQIEQICGTEIKRGQPEADLKKQLYQLVQKLMTVFQGDQEGNYVQLIPHAVYRGNTGFPREYYQGGVRIPFENIEIMLPVRYEAMLQKKYKNYMQIVRNGAAHNYPFFQSQKEQFEKILGYQLPRYQYSGVCPRRDTKEYSYKYRVSQYMQKFETVHENIRSGVDMLENLVEAQQNAIEMGNLIEQVKGEKHPVIRELEQYCEAVFELHCEASQKNRDMLYGKIRNLDCIGKQIEADIEELILKRKEVVFLPFGGKHWAAFWSVWEAAAGQSNCDVSVVPLPYYYKEYDGSFLGMKYDLSEYPQDIVLEDYQEFDLALRHPDIIYIQNPYDEWNSVTSIPKEYYSSEIRNYTEQLIYIPYFKVDEFEKEQERQYWNMNYYCTVPGVVNADQVFVQSQEMKMVYVEKLTEFAGEKTREIWEKKIVGIGSLLSDYKREVIDSNVSYPGEWERILQKPNGERKNLILFYVSMGALVQYKEKMIEQIGHMLTIASESEDVVFVWKEDPMISLNEKVIGEALYNKYQMMRQKVIEAEWIIYAKHMDDETLAAVCDGYYGVASVTGNKFQVLHKPIMICGSEV